MYYSLWQGFGIPWEDKTVPLIIWLQGGPGASSQFGCFNEVGPIYIEGKKGSYKVTENPWSWNFFGHLICIDQPVGVGFSYNNNTDKVNNTRDAANHFVNFLSNFYANNPKLNLKENPLYIAGESYAGHYIPAFAEKIKSNS
jgi:carboxypeptidase C (cathepsin A)